MIKWYELNTKWIYKKKYIDRCDEQPGQHLCIHAKTYSTKLTPQQDRTHVTQGDAEQWRKTGEIYGGKEFMVSFLRHR